MLPRLRVRNPAMSFRRLVGAVGALILLGPGPAAAAEPATRVPWTTSRIHGTPEPPHPYRVERAFRRLTFNNPVFLVRTPGIDRWFVGEERGKIYSFPRKPDVEQADLAIDLPKELHSADAAGKA